MNRIVRSLIWLVVFTIPWEDTLPIESLGTVTRILGYVAFGAALIALIVRGNMRRLRLTHCFMFLFVFWGGMSYIWSADPETTVSQLVTFAQLFALTWLIWEFEREQADQISLMKAYVLGSCVSIAGTFMNYRSGDAIDNIRYVATGLNPNQLGLILAISIPIAFYLSLREKRSTIAWAYRSYIALALTAILLTVSRGALLATGAAISIYMVTYSRQTRAQKMSMLVIVLVAAAASMILVPQASWERLSTTGVDLLRGQMTHRLEIWKAGVQLFVEHPLLGVGSGAFRVAVGPLLPVAFVAHNTFLSILTELGVIGFGIFLVLYYMLFSSAWKMPPVERGLWVVLLLTWTIGVWGGTWEYKKPTWILFALLIAQSVSLSRKYIWVPANLQAPTGDPHTASRPRRPMQHQNPMLRGRTSPRSVPSMTNNGATSTR